MVRCLIVASGRRISISSEPSLAFTVPILTASTEAFELSDGVKKCQGSETTKMSLHYSLPVSCVPSFRVYSPRTVFAIAIARKYYQEIRRHKDLVAHETRIRFASGLALATAAPNASSLNLSVYPGTHTRVQGLVPTCHCTEIRYPDLYQQDVAHNWRTTCKWRSNAEQREEQTTPEEPQPFALSLAAET